MSPSFAIAGLVEASPRIGLGHARRTLTLLGEWVRRGQSAVLVAPGAPPSVAEMAEREGVAFADEFTDNLSVLLILDGYGFTLEDERAHVEAGRRLLVIDDLARPHNADVLLDVNLVEGYQTRYEGKLPKSCMAFLGPHYALLRPDFHVARANLAPRTGEIRRVLVAYGGADPTHETPKAIAALDGLGLEMTVVAGPMAKTAGGPHVLVDPPHLAHLMATHDLFIGAAGGMTWERCYLGLPAIMTVVADNQRELASAVAAAGAGILAGESEQVTPETLRRHVMRLTADPKLGRSQSEAALAVMGLVGPDRLEPVYRAMESRR